MAAGEALDGLPGAGDGRRRRRDARRHGVDPDFGPMVACGAGGVTVELTRDVAVRMAPLTDRRRGRDGARRSRCFPLLDGFRGAPQADVRALEDVCCGVSALAADQPDDRRAGLQPGDRPRAGRGHRRCAGERPVAARPSRRSPAAPPSSGLPPGSARRWRVRAYATSTVPESGLSPMADGLDPATIALDLQEKRR